MIGTFQDCDVFRLYLPPQVQDYHCCLQQGFQTFFFTLGQERVAYAPLIPAPHDFEQWLHCLRERQVTRIDYVREPWMQRYLGEMFMPLGFLEEYIYPHERFADFRGIYKKRQQARKILDDVRSLIRGYEASDERAVCALYAEWQERRGQQLEDYMLRNVLTHDWVEKLVLLIDDELVGFLAYKASQDTLVMIQNFSRPHLTGANTALLHIAAQRHPHLAYINYGDCQTGSVLLEIDDTVLENLSRAKAQLKPSAILVFRSYRVAQP